MGLWSHISDVSHYNGTLILSLILGEAVTSFLKGVEFGTQGTLQ